MSTTGEVRLPNEGWGDGDATPRPLRIIKRGQQSPFGFSAVRQPDRGGVSGREWSVPLLVVGPRGDTGAVAKPDSPRRGIHTDADTTSSGDALFVPKQRRTTVDSLRGSVDAGWSTSTSTSTRSYPRPAIAARDQLHTTTTTSPDLKRQSYRGAQWIPRATTTGTWRTPDLPCHYGHRPLEPHVSSARPRAFTADLLGLKHPQIDAPQLSSPQNPPTQPSLRSRLLSRVMNGVAGKAHHGHATMRGHSIAREPGEMPNAEAERLGASEAHEQRPETSSSMNTDMAFDADLDIALAAFPSPPKSTVTSPTTISSFETSRTTSSTARTLTEPKNVAIPNAQLNVLAETDELGSEGGQTILVAVEVVGGVTPMDAAAGEKPLPSVGLDVVIVIDNSLFASPGALMANCEAARFLASLLSTVTDRLAVLCTRPIKSNSKDPNIVSPLSRRSIRRIKGTVDAIVSSTNKPEPAALGTAVDRAIDLLTDPMSQQADDEPGGEAYGHVFVLTANAAGVPSILLTHEKIQVHMLRPGALPWKGSIGTVCSGWKLASLYSSSLQYMSLEKDKDRDSLFNRFRSLVLLARTGRCCGKLTDMVLEIEAGQECSIEAVMGQRDIASLRPGEVVTALIKVKVGAIFAKGYTLSPSPSLKISNSPMKPRDVFDELDVMLGASPTPIVIAKLTYKHSLLPAGTRCSTIGAAKLKRSLPHISEETAVAAKVNQGTADSRIMVQKRLVYHLATHHPPRQAIAELQDYFGNNTHEPLCPQYIKLVIEELKYQARICERFDVPSPIKGSVLSSRTTLPYEHFGQGLFIIPNHKPQDWLTGVSDEESPSNYSTQAQGRNYSETFSRESSKSETPRPRSRRLGASMPSTRQAGVPLSTRRVRGTASASKHNSENAYSSTSRESLDETRTIWGDLRKMSKSKRAPAESTSTNSQMDFRKGKWVRDLAIRSKENVGMDIPKGDATGQGKENAAPFLPTRLGIGSPRRLT